MSHHVKVSGTWRTTSQPYIKISDTEWKAATALYYKVDDTTWQEIWPLVPGAPTDLVSTQPYQNDRIELEFDWTAPATGAATEYYNVKVYLAGGLWASYVITAPTVAMTLTNGTAGFQSYAGSSMYFTVTPYSAGGRAGTMATSPTYTIPQLPAPPDPTSLDATLANGDPTITWSHVGGNRLTNFTLEVSYNGGAYTAYTIAYATSAVSTKHPWTGTSVNGGSFSIRVKANGPGGSSAYVTFSGNIPSDATASDSRFSSGFLQTTLYRGANCTSLDVYWQQGSWPMTFQGNTASEGVIQITGSDSWARDNTTQYRMVTQPRNSLGTGRATGHTYCRKITSPYVVSADDYATWRNSGWRTDSPNDIYQGYTTTGMNYGYLFYGNKFRDQLGSSYLGYSPNISAATIFVRRETDGGGSAARYPRLYLHKAANRDEADNVFDGYYDLTPPLAFGEYGALTCSGLVTWVTYLIAQVNGWQGFGFYNGDTSSSPSPQYMKFNTGPVVFVGTLGDVVIYHDG